MVLEFLGLDAAAGALRVQFEWHVYAGLRARGAVVEAAAFLAGSLLHEAMPECLRALQERRRCGGTQGGSAGRTDSMEPRMDADSRD